MPQAAVRKGGAGVVAVGKVVKEGFLEEILDGAEADKEEVGLAGWALPLVEFGDGDKLRTV